MTSSRRAGPPKDPQTVPLTGALGALLILPQHPVMCMALFISSDTSLVLSDGASGPTGQSVSLQGCLQIGAVS